MSLIVDPASSLLLPASADPATTRRSFLKRTALLGLGAGIASTVPVLPALASTPRVQYGGEIRDVDLYNTNTRETIRSVFYSQGRYDQSSFNQLCHFLRDAHDNIAHWMDPKLLTALADIQAIFDKRQIRILSGYRTPRTNARLARNQRGVGKNSFHMKGQAVDIRIPGVDTRHVRDVARVLQIGGVGYYARANFVHIDTGPIRHWQRG